ncbi:unnamed protein product [Ectocarpus sp. 8 AP-2014]
MSLCRVSGANTVVHIFLLLYFLFYPSFLVFVARSCSTIPGCVARDEHVLRPPPACCCGLLLVREIHPSFPCLLLAIPSPPTHEPPPRCLPSGLGFRRLATTL